MTRYTGWNLLRDPSEPPGGNIESSIAGVRTGLSALLAGSRGYPGPWLELIELEGVASSSGQIFRGAGTIHGSASDSKIVRLAGPVNIENTLREFALDCAERMAPIYSAVYPIDERLKKAIAGARRFIQQGPVTLEDAIAAWGAVAAAKDTAPPEGDPPKRKIHKSHIAASSVAAAMEAVWAPGSTIRALGKVIANADLAAYDMATERAWQEKELTRRFQACIYQEQIEHLRILDAQI